MHAQQDKKSSQTATGIQQRNENEKKKEEMRTERRMRSKTRKAARCCLHHTALPLPYYACLREMRQQINKMDQQIEFMNLAEDINY